MQWYQICYVCLCVQTSAAQAVLKMDGHQMEEHTISVAISNPPARNAPQQQAAESSKFVPSLGGGKKETAA